ncbi:hypothetical protein Q1695_007211 [Nippostrongylus brasiliensis]|nr:hypothetical protein Q1695_007211 [Nippostrongylus brasiliensis]
MIVSSRVLLVDVMLLLLLGLPCLNCQVFGLIARDCTEPGINISEMDMTAVTGCQDEPVDASEKSVQLQLLQLNEEMKA